MCYKEEAAHTKYSYEIECCLPTEILTKEGANCGTNDSTKQWANNNMEFASVFNLAFQIQILPYEKCTIGFSSSSDIKQIRNDTSA